MKKLKSLKLMLLGLVALVSTNAFAAAEVWYANGAGQNGADVVVAETAGQTYAPVVDGKSPLVYTIIYVKSNSGQNGIDVGYVSVAKNAGQMDNYTTIEIPEKVQIPVTVTDGSVKFDGVYEFNVTEIADNGFIGTKLQTITNNAKLTKIGANAFKNSKLNAITLNSDLTEIGANAFENTLINSVSIPAKVATIGASAFEGCENLATVTVPAASQLTAIGAGAFAYTSLATLDLSGATANPNGTGNNPNDDGMRAFPSVGGGNPFVSATPGHTTNMMIKTVVLPTTCRTIKAGAFANVKNLATISLVNVETIEAEAFNGCAKLTAQVIATGNGLKVKGIGQNAFANCSKLVALEFGKIDGETNVDAKAFGGVAGAAAVPDDMYTNNELKAIVTAVEGLANDDTELGAANAAAINAVMGTTYTATTTRGNAAEYAGFKTLVDGLAAGDDETIYIQTPGTPAVPATAAAPLVGLAFNAIEATLSATAFNLATIRLLSFNNYIKTANRIPAGAFNAAFPDDTEDNIINYIYTDRGNNALVNAFAATAFAVGVVDKIITMNTTAEFEHDYGNAINKVNVIGGYTDDEYIGKGTGDAKELVKDVKSNNYYYYVTLPAGIYKSIDKNQESGATVNIYQAYMDVAGGEATVYFVPVSVKNGAYVIGDVAKSTFIIKSNQINGVKASVGAAANTTVVYEYDNSIPDFVIKNKLNNTENNTYSVLKVQTDAQFMNGGENDVWFFNNPATSGFGFTKFNPENQKSGMGKNTVYMTCPATAASRLNMVWLDENGNTTAIETIENKAETLNSAVMYNVAGQKVGADYKGLVIKNGKKFVQK